MTKVKIVILSTLVLSVAFGATGSYDITSTFIDRSDLEVLWENPYEYDLLTGMIMSSGVVHCQDDFDLVTSGWIKGFECWSVYEGAPPEPFELTIRYDHYGKPGGTLLTAYVTDVTDTDTGDDLFGFDVWHTELLLDVEDYVFIEAGTPYWLEIYWTFCFFYWCAEDGGNAHVNGEEWDASVFFTVLGTPSGAGVEESSWGEIKAGEW